MRSREQTKNPELPEDAMFRAQEQECCSQSDAGGTSLGPIEYLLGKWTDIIKGAIFPEQEENKQTVNYDTRLHDGTCLVLL